MYFIIMMFLFMLSCLMFLFSILFFYFNNSLILEWLLFSMNSFNMEFLILFDWISLLFMSIVLLISSLILAYSNVYMESEKFLSRFYYLLLLFVLSMIFMIMSPNMISIMLGWDGLGLVSFCLVIFYQNYSSYNSGIITVLMNRIGDIFILMSISLMMIYGSWNLYMLVSNFKFLIIFIMLASMTKSAQLPFSQWLPLAMAAPTPISALVHSSTLVTAGIYLMIRFNKYLFVDKMNKFLLLISILTMFMSGLMANFEFDLKKIIALSTLSQLGFMLMILSLGFYLLSFYHLLIHAIFKSLLFMSSGNVIHFMNNNQDIRKLGNLSEFIPFSMISFQITLFALCGIPFMSGFYSKDLIMEMIYFNNINILMLIMSLISLMFTLSYSMRLMYYMSFKELNMMNLNFIYENKLISKSMILLMIMSIISGSMLSWIFFFENFIFLKLTIKMLTILFMFLSLLMFIFLKLLIYLKIYYLSFNFSSMWFLNYLVNMIKLLILKYSISLFYNDKVWMEFLSKNFLLQMYFYFKNFMMNYKYKIFMFMYWFLIIIFFMYF